MLIKNEYRLQLGGEYAGTYYIYDDGSAYFGAARAEGELKEKLKELKLDKSITRKRPIKRFSAVITEENRVPGRKQPVYVFGELTLTRIPRETGEKYWVYRRSAEKGEPGWDPKDHSAPHREGPNTPEGMREWCSRYCFSKMDDGTFEAELDEAWWWGGAHNDGGTMRRPIPEEWFALDYGEFLENVVTLAAARHYKFEAADLMEKPGLKAFFGFE